MEGAGGRGREAGAGEAGTLAHVDLRIFHSLAFPESLRF